MTAENATDWRELFHELTAEQIGQLARRARRRHLVDDSDIERRCARAVDARGRDDAGQPRPVGQRLDMARPYSCFHTPQQVSTGPGSLTPELESVEAAVGEH